MFHASFPESTAESTAVSVRQWATKLKESLSAYEIAELIDMLRE
tara:strand:- start:9631 stop:9762 length:132 start_codon:yes stop_codon:yes gene_type:complete